MTDNKTPIQQVKDFLDHKIACLDAGNSYDKGQIDAYGIVFDFVDAMIPTEKEFAGKVFDAGVESAKEETFIDPDNGELANNNENIDFDKQQFLNRYYKL